jgi:16S rRNA C1402 (ribose-2'-O) methylase RsmI
LVREQTKLHEEVIRGSAGFLLERLKGDTLKGEFTIVVSGRGEERNAPFLDEEIKKRIEIQLNEGKMSLKDIARQIADKEGLTYRTVYRECLMIKEEVDDPSVLSQK